MKWWPLQESFPIEICEFERPPKPRSFVWRGFDGDCVGTLFVDDLCAAEFGDEQVHIWRRSYDTLPPEMAKDHEHSAHTDRRYAHLDDSVIPDAENLKVTLERALPFWEDKIAPALKDGKNVFVGAHGNSIRALVKHIKQLSDDEIMDVEIPNFPPLVFELDENLNIVKEYYLEA